MANVKRFPGEYVGLGTYRTMWACPICKIPTTTASGTYSPHIICYKCEMNGIIVPMGMMEVENQKWRPTHTEVHCCGNWLNCDGFTNTCPHCNADYNSNGQILAHRSQWGEDTGETYADFAVVGVNDDEWEY